MKKLQWIALFFISTSLFANICPTAQAIQQKIQFDVVIPYQSGWNVGQYSNTFDTSDTWSFEFIGLPGEDADSALQNAKLALTSLHFEDSHPVPPPRTWACIYHGAIGKDNNYLAVMFTPPLVI